MEAVPWEELKGKHLVVEEKIDGANCGVSFTENSELLLQSRGHYLHGGPREKQFNLLKQWASTKQLNLFCALGARYIMYGEWMFAKHTYFYDALPHYFMEFDVYDTKENVFLSTEERGKLLNHNHFGWSIVCPVRVIAEGKFDKLKDLESMITKSHFITDDRVANFLNAASSAGVLPKDSAFGNKEISEVMATGDWSPLMEGLYVKWEEDGIVKGRYKYVRNTFTNAILDQEQHWHDRPIIQNLLVDGACDRMFL